MRISFGFLFSIFLFGSVSFAQTFPPMNVDVTIDGEILRNPLTGGMNNPQPSEVDLNNDGIQDLFIFDRTGDQVLPFLNKGTASEPDYEYAPEFADNFPPLKKWVLLRDFNDDGIQDIFCSDFLDTTPAFGIAVFKGKIQGGQIAFDRVNFSEMPPFNVLNFPDVDGQNWIQVTTADYPTVTDVDDDGDLDVLTFDPDGSYLRFFKNLSLENGWGTDTLFFELADECWGNFIESFFDETIVLSDVPTACAIGQPNPNPDTPQKVIHAGSTTSAFDMDGDMDKDLFVGDLATGRVTFLHNDGSLDDAFITEKDITYPSFDEPVLIPEFVATFQLDVDGDGLKDFIAAPNNTQFTLNRNVMWFYKNTGTAEVANFEFQQRDFMVDNMIDIGDGANPTFVDYNADGLLDLVVGNNTFYVFGGQDSRLFLFENIGTETEPAFELVDDNWLNFQQYNQFSWDYAPTFGDLDSDGDLDLVVGDRFGFLFFVENIAGEGNPMTFSDPVPQWLGIDIGSNAVPQIIDLNRDELNDLVIGARNGLIAYFPNQGTPTEPEFIPDENQAPNNFFLGQIDVSENNTGYSAPYFIDTGSDFLLFSGSERGIIFQYDNIEDQLDGAFNLVDQTFGNISTGQFSRIAVADLNDDGALEIMVGNERGGLRLFQTNVNTSGAVPNNNLTLKSEVEIFPNPSEDYLYVKLPTDYLNEFNFQIFNTLGQKVHEFSASQGTLEINIEDWESGVYYIKIDNQTFSETRKIIKN